MAFNIQDPENGRLADELEEIAIHCASLPVLDHRTEDEILDYNESGIPR